MPTTSRYSAKENEIIGVPRERKTVEPNLDEKHLPTSAAALNASSQGSNQFTLLLKMLVSGTPYGSDCRE